MAPFNLTLTAIAALTSLACMILLFRAYASSGLRLLLWSALCFVCLTVNNLFLFLDFAIAEIDFRPYRLAAALVGLGFLLYGFIWEAE